MTPALIISLIFILLMTVAFGFSAFFLVRSLKSRTQTETPVDEEKERLKQELEQLQRDRQRQEGELNQLVRTSADQRAELQAHLQIERNRAVSLQEKVSRLESAEKQRDAETDRKLSELNRSRTALEQERERVIADEKERRRQEEENRSRIWNDHEQASIRVMNEVCRKPEFLFNTFDNTNLPDSFDSKFKPDFMIRFLDQYIIFDAKLSRGDLATYIKTQVKDTAGKIKKSPACDTIYKTVFFVIPTISMNQLSQFSYFEGGYRFHVIPVEAFEPVLACFKKLEDYDLADKYDPQERENVINLIAAFDHHIRKQNAVNILNTIEGLKILSEKESLPRDIGQAVNNKVKDITTRNITRQSMDSYIKDPEKQIREVEKLIEPKDPEVSRQELDSAAPLSVLDSEKESGKPSGKKGSSTSAKGASRKSRKSSSPELNFS